MQTTGAALPAARQCSPACVLMAVQVLYGTGLLLAQEAQKLGHPVLS